MEDDVAKALAYQVKRDLAERYFGLRKLIEEDSANYFRQVEKIKKELLPPLKKDWFRMYVLLVDQGFAREFAELVGFSSPPFYEEFLKLKDPFSLLEGLTLKGLTLKGKFKNLVREAYERLYEGMNKYQKAFKEARVEAEVINHEIELFKEKYDLSEIMQFLKSLEVSSAFADLGHTSLEESVKNLERSLSFEKIPPPEKFIPLLPQIPPLKNIKTELEALATVVVRYHLAEVKKIVQYVKSHPPG